METLKCWAGCIYYLKDYRLCCGYKYVDERCQTPQTSQGKASESAYTRPIRIINVRSSLCRGGHSLQSTEVLCSNRGVATLASKHAQPMRKCASASAAAPALPYVGLSSQELRRCACETCNLARAGLAIVEWHVLRSTFKVDSCWLTAYKRMLGYHCDIW